MRQLRLLGVGAVGGGGGQAQRRSDGWRGRVRRVGDRGVPLAGWQTAVVPLEQREQVRQPGELGRRAVVR